MTAADGDAAAAPQVLRTRRGREFVVFGDAALLTMDRLAAFTERADADPRIASVSLVPGPARPGRWVRASAAAGPLVAVAGDLDDLVGPAADLDTVPQWLARASARGLWHDWWVTADADVAHAPAVLPAPDVERIEADDRASAVHAAMRSHRRRGRRLTVTVDATWLGPHETGAQVLTTAAVAALADQPGIDQIRLVGIDELPPYAAHLAGRPRIVVSAAEPDVPMADIVWYPNQIDARSNISMARRLGARVVTTYLDLIAYDIERYHGSREAWLTYRSLQRRIALSVDGITAISADVADRLLAEVPRLDPERVLALPLGLDHISAAAVPTEPDPDAADLRAALGGRRFVLVLGNDFVHKNRDFAIRVWEETLRAGQPCDLVLAGLHVRGSSSRDAEADLAARHLDLRGRLHTLGHVESATRTWLLANAAAVLYPSSAEGFGFVPYEAAALGTPTVFTDFGPLREVSGTSGLPARWTVEAYATDLTALLTDDTARAQRLDQLHDAIRRLSWTDFAARLAEFFERVSALPEVPTSVVGADAAAADAAALSAILSSRTWRATAPLRRLGGRMRRR